MIDAQQALNIADEEARNLGWGSITKDSHDAVAVEVKNRQAWDVDSKDMFVIGKRVRFLIDAETGQILERRRMGRR